MDSQSDRDIESLTTSVTSPNPLQKEVAVDKESAPAVDQSNEIEHLYLEFDTPLPTPVLNASPGSESRSPPAAPDLKPYTSPFLWPDSRKSLTTTIACLVTILAASTAGEFTAAAAQLQHIWNMSATALDVGITSFTTGFAVAPMILAPFSEINGRRPLFILSGILFTVCQVGAGATNSYAGIIVARFFQGVGGSTYSTIVGGVISDIYHADKRNTPMAIFSGAALFGTGLGPLMAGIISQHTTWRWIFYTHALASAVSVVIMWFFLKETRGSVLLSRKAKILNRYYEDLEAAGYYGMLFSSDVPADKNQPRRIRWKVRSDEERESLVKMIKISCYRPFHLLFTEPVVFFFSLWVAFSWAVLYLQFGSIPLVFQTNHGFNLEQTGAVFTAMCVGAVLATLLSIYQEHFALKFGKLSSTPEGRLYFACIESILMPAGMFWFGWTSYPSIPWIVPALAVGCATMGVFSIYLAVFNYLADTYHRYASSAIAAQSFCRNLLGGVFPLVTNALFTNLGYPAASSLLGGIGAILTIVPWVLVFYGPTIRARSKFASDLVTARN